MRIISTFNDYYDGVMRTGMDREVVYVRETTEILIKDDFEVYMQYASNYSYDLRYIGFCGQIYKFGTIRIDNKSYHYHDLEDFKNDSINFGILKDYDFKGRWWKGHVLRFFEEDTSPLLEFFHKYQTPIFLIQCAEEKNKQKLILNPRLRQYEFQRVKDSYTAYQDIFQFVAGTLNKPENKMVKISDKDKVAKHGFDKWSFRQKGPKK